MKKIVLKKMVLGTVTDKNDTKHVIVRMKKKIIQKNPRNPKLVMNVLMVMNPRNPKPLIKKIAKLMAEHGQKIDKNVIQNRTIIQLTL